MFLEWTKAWYRTLLHHRHLGYRSISEDVLIGGALVVYCIIDRVHLFWLTDLLVCFRSFLGCFYGILCHIDIDIIVFKTQLLEIIQLQLLITHSIRRTNLVDGLELSILLLIVHNRVLRMIAMVIVDNRSIILCCTSLAGNEFPNFLIPLEWLLISKAVIAILWAVELLVLRLGIVIL